MSIVFVKKAGIDRWPVERVNTSTGTMAISTPEVTALDLVRYVAVAGQLSNVATVLSELGEKIDPHQLVTAVAQTGVEMSVVQRLGYLLDRVEMGEVAAPLATWVENRSPRLVPLRPVRPMQPGEPTDPRWRVRINTDVEPNL